MQSTSRLLKAAEIAFINSGVAMSLLVVVTSGMLASLVSCFDDCRLCREEQ
jgi:hypothetical protein